VGVRRSDGTREVLNQQRGYAFPYGKGNGNRQLRREFSAYRKTKSTIKGVKFVSDGMEL
jgi:hypothetical protein